MDITAIIYAAIGGAAGVVIGSLLFSLFSKSNREASANPIHENQKEKTRGGVRSGLVGGLSVAVSLFLVTLYKNMVLPRIVPLDLTEFTESAAIYGVIQEQSPEDFKRLTAPFDRIARKGDMDQDDLTQVRAILFELIAEKSATANASVLREAANVQRLQYEEYKEVQPSICTQVVNGLPFPDVSEILSEKIIKLEEEQMVKLFKEAPRDTNLEVNLDRGKKLYGKVFTDATEEAGVINMKPNSLGTTENRLEHQKVCDFGRLNMTKLIELDDADLIHVTMYLNSKK